MKKKEPTTYEYPTLIQKRYLKLTKSKESFSKKLTNAERRNLEKLYDQLNDCWKRNNTTELSKTLDLKYKELRELQKQLKTDWQDFEKNMDQKESGNIQTEEKNLQNRRENFRITLMAWKKDIKQKEKNLSLKKAELKRSQMKLQDVFNRSNPKEEELMKLVEKREKLSETLNLNNQELEIEFQTQKLSLERMQFDYESSLTETQRLLFKPLEKEEKLYKKQLEAKRQLEIQALQEILEEKNQISNELDQLLITIKEEELQQNQSMRKIMGELNEISESFEKETLNKFVQEVIQEAGGLTPNMKGWTSLKSPSFIIKKLDQYQEELNLLIRRKLEGTGMTFSEAFNRFENYDA